MSADNILGVISVVPVRDFDNACSWYEKLFGRAPDIVPTDGIAEWQLVQNGWVQVATDPERAGTANVAILVGDLEAQCNSCASADLSMGEIVEYSGIVIVAETSDPDGNKISFVQTLSHASDNDR